eukprot:jgi/Botrbrau1/19594/Bobra.0035s0072.1
MLGFGNPDVETLYQTFLQERIIGGMWFFSWVIVGAWALNLLKLSNSSFVDSRISAMSVAVVCNLVPSVALVFGIPRRPKFFSNNWRGINLSLQLFQACLWNYVREPLVRQLYLSQVHQDQMSVLLRAFLAENVFLISPWLRMLVFPSGIASDFAIATITLLVAMSGNAQLCASPIPGSVLVTASQPMRGLAQTMSTTLLVTLGHFSHPAWGSVPPPSSCTGLLTFWEVVGWWLACLAIVGREVASRLAFIRANPRVVRQAGLQKWPFENACKVKNGMVLVILSFSTLGLVWGTCLRWVETPAVMATT